MGRVRFNIQTDQQIRMANYLNVKTIQKLLQAVVINGDKKKRYLFFNISDDLIIRTFSTDVIEN